MILNSFWVPGRCRHRTGSQGASARGDSQRSGDAMRRPVERLRDILINRDIVREAATRDVPALRKMIEHLVHMLEPANSSERRDS